MENINKGTKSFWIKKIVSQRAWNNFYSQNNIYCSLGTEGLGTGKKVMVGYLVANEIPQDCEPCTDDELIQIDDYRKANEIYPRPLKPLKDIKKEENKVQESQPEEIKIEEKGVWDKPVF